MAREKWGGAQAKWYSKEVIPTALFDIFGSAKMLNHRFHIRCCFNHIRHIVRVNLTIFQVSWVAFARFFVFWVDLYIFAFRFSVFATFLLSSSQLGALVRWGPSTLVLYNFCVTGFIPFFTPFSQVRYVRGGMMASRLVVLV